LILLFSFHIGKTLQALLLYSFHNFSWRMFFLATALAAMQLFRQRYSQLSSIVSDAAGKRQRKRCDPVAASSAASD
jgi:hypothetical protein